MSKEAIYITVQRPGIGTRMLFLFLFFLGAMMIIGFDGSMGLLAFGLILCLLFGLLFLAHAKVYYDHNQNKLISNWSIYLLTRTETDDLPPVSYIAVVSVNVTSTVNSRVRSVSVTEGKFNINLIHPKGSNTRYTTIATKTFKEAMNIAKEIRKQSGLRIYMSAGPRKAWVD